MMQILFVFFIILSPEQYRLLVVGFKFDSTKKRHV